MTSTNHHTTRGAHTHPDISPTYRRWVLLTSITLTLIAVLSTATLAADTPANSQATSTTTTAPTTRPPLPHTAKQRHLNRQKLIKAARAAAAARRIARLETPTAVAPYRP